MTEPLRKVILWASFAVTAAFGLAQLVVPEQLNELYGGETTDSLVGLSRLFGAVTLAFPVLALMALRVEDVAARRAIDATFLAGWALIALVTVWNYYAIPAAGDVDALLYWGTTALYVVLAAAFAYELFGPDMRGAPSRARPT